MSHSNCNMPRGRSLRRAFSLVEMMVVIAIMAILLTMGAGIINSAGGKGVTAGVSTAEAAFAEAKAIAIGKNIRTCVLVAQSLDNSTESDLRRVVVAEETTTNGIPDANPDQEPRWQITSRGITLPEGVYFSQELSRRSFQTDSGDLDTVSAQIRFQSTAQKSSMGGTYFIYRFTALGTAENPGSSFVIGAGSRNTTKAGDSSLPRVTKSSERDFSGFVLWRNGNTSVFRSPTQISSAIDSLTVGSEF